jgi:hypothetical protein
MTWIPPSGPPREKAIPAGDKAAAGFVVVVGVVVVTTVEGGRRVAWCSS